MYYYLFILAIGAERLVELVVSRRNTNWSLAHGGREFGRGHYPVMTAMHSAGLTAVIFSLANAAVLNVRIKTENRALGYA
jgi:methyltransferase